MCNSYTVTVFTCGYVKDKRPALAIDNTARLQKDFEERFKERLDFVNHPDPPIRRQSD